jgi:phosphoesterase RecJ-like protein
MSQISSVLQIADLLKENSSFALVSHVSPDADAYGSISALASALRDLKKDVQLLNESGFVSQYKFIPLISEVASEWPQVLPQVLIICDCGDQKRIGDRFFSTKPKFSVEINIDHHQSNKNYADYNLVNSDASSTAELVFEIIEALGVELTTVIATGLLAGLMGDTGSFNFGNTTPRVLEIAAKLVRAGANPSLISGEMFYNDSLARVRLKAEGLSRVEVFLNDRIAIAVVDQALLDKYALTSADLDGLVDQVRRISTVQIAVLIYRDDTRWKVSMRGKLDGADLSKVANEFGGGGHKLAAAFRSTEELELIKSKLIDRLAGELK